MNVAFLTAEEERELVIKAHAGDINARNAVISNIDQYIWKFAKKLAKGDPEKAEFYHAEAVTVLCNKFHKYDVSFGCKFITWASSWIYQAIQQYRIYHEHGGIRLPPHYAWQEGGDPHVQQARRILSADGEIEFNKGKPFKISSIITDHRHPSPDSDLQRADRIALVKEVLQKIQPRYAEILMLRTSMRLEDVGKKLGVTRERVRQLEAKAMDKFIEAMKRIAPNQINELETEIRESNRTFAARFLRRVNMNMTRQDEMYENDSPQPKMKKSQIIANVVRELGVGATYKQIKENLVANHNVHTYDAAIANARREVFGDAAVKSSMGKRPPKPWLNHAKAQQAAPAKNYAVVNGKGEMERLRAVKTLAKECGGLNELARMVEFLQELAS